MDDRGTTIVVQRYLDELADVGSDASSEPVIRALLSRSINRLRMLSQSMLYRQYSRLTKGPMNLQTDELLSGVVERLIKAMREVRPRQVRQFFALANQHLRWELNDLARRLDNAPPAVGLNESQAAAGTESAISGDNLRLQRILQAIDALEEDEREIFTLVHIQGMTRVEAAEVVGVSEKTVKRRLSRSLVYLTSTLSEMLPERGFPGTEFNTGMA